MCYTHFVLDSGDFDIIFHTMLLCVLKQICTRMHSYSRAELFDTWPNIFSTSLTNYTIAVENQISGHERMCLTCYFASPHINKKREVCCVKYYARANNESVLDYFEFALDSFNHRKVDIM